MNNDFPTFVGIMKKYTAVGMDDRLFVSKYMLKLPDKKLLESFLKRELNQ